MSGVANIHSTLSYVLVNALPGMAIDPASGSFTWTPSQQQSATTNTVTVTATSTDTKDLVNPALTTTYTFTVVVKEVNVAPTAPAISLQSVNELNLLTVNAAAADLFAGGVANIHSTLSYVLVNALPGMAIDPASGCSPGRLPSTRAPPPTR